MSLRSIKYMAVLGWLLMIIYTSLYSKPTSQDSLYWYCPVCHGQTLWESNHPEALSIVEQITCWEREDQSPEEIQQNLYQKYGSQMFRTAGNRWIIVFLLGVYWCYRAGLFQMTFSKK